MRKYFKWHDQKLKTFYDAWWYLHRHKMFADNNFLDERGNVIYSAFDHLLDIDVQKVNPLTNKISDWGFLNTKVQVWLECGSQWQDEDNGEWHNNSHDVNLDCGGDTFESAIINLAKLVEQFYPIQAWGKLE